jgi:hypothetical protein
MKKLVALRQGSEQLRPIKIQLEVEYVCGSRHVARGALEAYVATEIFLTGLYVGSRTTETLGQPPRGIVAKATRVDEVRAHFGRVECIAPEHDRRSRIRHSGTSR